MVCIPDALCASFPASHMPCPLPLFDALTVFVPGKLVPKYHFLVLGVLLFEGKFRPCSCVCSKFTLIAVSNSGVPEQVFHFSRRLYEVPTAYESFQRKWFLPVCLWDLHLSLPNLSLLQPLLWRWRRESLLLMLSVGGANSLLGLEMKTGRTAMITVAFLMSW